MVCLKLTQDVVENYMRKLIRLLQNDLPIPKAFKKNDLITILHSVQDIYAEEPILLEFDLPKNGLIVVGDLHGDMYCLLKILLDNGFPPTTSYLFLGDYIDRGRYQIELILFIFLMKLRWPNYITTLKGNHEDFQCGLEYQFYDECKLTFHGNTQWYTFFNQVFDHMPVCAIISNHFFACHGGISQWLCFRENVKNISKPTYTKYMTFQEGVLLADLLWADPVADQIKKFDVSSRNCGYTFNKQALDLVLKALGLKTLIRGHEYYAGGTARNFGDDSCFTVHSTTDMHRMHEPYSGILEVEKVNNKFVITERRQRIPREAKPSPLASEIEESVVESFAHTLIAYYRTDCRWCQQPYPLYITRRKRIFMHHDIILYMAKYGKFVLRCDKTYNKLTIRTTKQRRCSQEATKRAIELFPLTVDFNYGRMFSFSKDDFKTLRIEISSEEYALLQKVIRQFETARKGCFHHHYTKYDTCITQSKREGRFKKLKRRIKRAMGRMEAFGLKNTMSMPVALPVAEQFALNEEVNGGRINDAGAGEDKFVVGPSTFASFDTTSCRSSEQMLAKPEITPFFDHRRINARCKRAIGKGKVKEILKL